MDRFISAFACRICEIMSKNVPVSVSWTELVLRLLAWLGRASLRRYDAVPLRWLIPARMGLVDIDRNKDLIRRWIAFSNSGFAGGFDSFIAADYVGHLGAATMDRTELERLERQFCMAFPDLHHTIDDLIAEDDRVVLRTTARATHDGDFEGIPRTGRAVVFTGLVIYRIVGDKIAESWGEIDFLRLIRELRRP
jgi:predicted ester cyclase